MEHPGRKYIPTLKDHFYVDGPNGRHLCLVMDVAGPSVFCVQEHCEVCRLTTKLVRKVSKQVMLAVDYLHQCGIAHGGVCSFDCWIIGTCSQRLIDIHTRNILFRYPGLDTLEQDQLIDILDTPRTGLVTRVDGTPCPPNVPKYVVTPTEYKNLTPFPNFEEIQLIDFGGGSVDPMPVFATTNISTAFFHDEPPPTLTTPVCFHPPELVFRHSLGKAVDIWGLANTVSYRILWSLVRMLLLTRSWSGTRFTNSPQATQYSGRSLLITSHKILKKSWVAYLKDGCLKE